MVAISLKFGTFEYSERPSANKADAMIGSAAFLAPLTVISPWRRFPPVMRNFFIGDPIRSLIRSQQYAGRIVTDSPHEIKQFSYHAAR
jgi:hypothetical protein